MNMPDPATMEALQALLAERRRRLSVRTEVQRRARLQALLAERARRETWRASVRAIVHEHFELRLGDRRARCRRAAVYALVAKAFGQVVPENGYWIRRVAAVVEGMGVIAISPGNARMFLYLAPRGTTDPSERESGERVKGFSKPKGDGLALLDLAWKGILAAEGFDDIEDEHGNLREDGTRNKEHWHAAEAREIREAYFSRATDFLWNHDWSKERAGKREMWEAHAIEGLSVRELAARFGVPKSNVDRFVRRCKAAMGWRW